MTCPDCDKQMNKVEMYYKEKRPTQYACVAVATSLSW